MTTSSPRLVTDETGVGYELGTLISRGGQGAVYRVVGHPNLAVKLLDREHEIEQIKVVRRLPLEGLHVARPTTLLQAGGAGYIMQMAQEMAPLSASYLPTDFGQGHHADWYRETGGLRRRLRIAARLAALMSRLHELSLAYIDLNPGNVMVSEDRRRDETWLIDTDNLTSAAHGSSRVIGLPGYLAPERSRRHLAPPSTLADTYSLAVLVFRLLALSHPLMGLAADAYEAGEARDLADQGEFPYIHDPNDTSNQPVSPITARLLQSVVLSVRLRKLAEATFTAGKLEPAKRPGSAAWRDALFSAADNTIECPDGCGWTMYRSAKQCVACQASIGTTTSLAIHTPWSKPDGASNVSVLALAPEGITAVRPRHLWGQYDDHNTVMRLSVERSHVELQHEDGVRVLDAQTERPVTKLSIPRAGGAKALRVEVARRPDRLLVIKSSAAP